MHIVPSRLRMPKLSDDLHGSMPRWYLRRGGRSVGLHSVSLRKLLPHFWWLVQLYGRLRAWLLFLRVLNLLHGLSCWLLLSHCVEPAQTLPQRNDLNWYGSDLHSEQQQLNVTEHRFISGFNEHAMHRWSILHLQWHRPDHSLQQLPSWTLLPNKDSRSHSLRLRLVRQY